MAQRPNGTNLRVDVRFGTFACGPDSEARRTLVFVAGRARTDAKDDVATSTATLEEHPDVVTYGEDRCQRHLPG